MSDIPSHTYPVVLRPWHRSLAGARIAPHGDVAGARLRLTSSIGDEVAITALRQAALALGDGTDLSRLDDHQLVDLLAGAAAEGRLRTDMVRVELFKFVRVSASEPTSPPAASAPRAASTAPPSTADTTFGSDLSVEAMVAVLSQAAQDGVPFCEECARARAEAAG